MTTLWIDVSHHDRNRHGGPLDWNAIRNAGLGNIMAARVSYGDPGGYNPSTSYALELVQGAKNAGYTIRLGYHNLIHGDQASINRQVDYLRSRLDFTGATHGMADIEPYNELKTNGLWPRWTDVQRFHDRWYALDQRPMTWYIARWVWRDWLGHSDLRYLKGPLTNAAYPDGDGTAQQIYTAAGADTGSGWSTYNVVVNNVVYSGHRIPDNWQYTSNGNVPGASSQTDVNAFRGTVADFARLLGVAAVPVSTGELVGGGDVL